jgi:hypothetical protein
MRPKLRPERVTSRACRAPLPLARAPTFQPLHPARHRPVRGSPGPSGARRPAVDLPLFSDSVTRSPPFPTVQTRRSAR